MPRREKSSSSLFGTLLQTRRDYLKLTRREIARLSGVSESFIVDLELRDTKKPSPTTFQNIARILACKTSEQAMSCNINAGEPPWAELDQEVTIDLIFAYVGINRKELGQWMPLRELRDGATFVTVDQVRAVKSAHQDSRKPHKPILCVLLRNGEYINLAETTLVRECEVE